MKRVSLNRILSSPLYISIFLFILLGYISLLPSIGYDEYLWTYIGRLWNRDEIPPYIGAVENKSPGIFFLYTFADFISKGSIFFIRILGVLSVIITSNILFLITKYLHNRVAGIYCMLVFGLSMGWVLFDGFAFSQTETFMVLFSSISFYFLIVSEKSIQKSKLLFLSGLMMGLAILFKQIALTTLIALIIIFLVSTEKDASFRKKFNGFFIIGFGILITLFISYIILLLNGVSFYDYIEGAWLILLNSGSKAPDFEISFSNFSRVFFSLRFICFHPILILFFILRKKLKDGVFKMLLIWLCFDFIGVNASGYYYGHQIKQILPVLAIISGIVSSDLLNKKRFENLVFKKYSISFIVVLVIFFPLRQVYRVTNMLVNDNLETTGKAGDWIEEHTKTSEYIFVMGSDYKLVQALSTSKRKSSSKYFNGIFISGKKEQDIVYSDLLNKPPELILKIENDTTYIKKYGKKIITFFNKKYDKVKKIDGVEIFKLKQDYI